MQRFIMSAVLVFSFLLGASHANATTYNFRISTAGPFTLSTILPCTTVNQHYFWGLGVNCKDSSEIIENYPRTIEGYEILNVNFNSPVALG